nr:MAG TPA: hypothetical protein [Caudoviricetes sp.]
MHRCKSGVFGVRGNILVVDWRYCVKWQSWKNQISWHCSHWRKRWHENNST